MARARIRRRPAVLGAAVLVVLFAGGLALFQPRRLWTTTTVNEAAPGTDVGAVRSARVDPSPSAVRPNAAGARELSVGTFVSHEHQTSGRVRLLQLPDGSRILRLENLATSDGPALHVWLSDQPVTADGWRVFDDGAHLDLGDLKGNRGNQNYLVPPTADLGALTSVSIWCSRFRVSFGAASLTGT